MPWTISTQYYNYYYYYYYYSYYYYYYYYYCRDGRPPVGCSPHAVTDAAPLPP